MDANRRGCGGKNKKTVRGALQGTTGAGVEEVGYVRDTGPGNIGGSLKWFCTTTSSLAWVVAGATMMQFVAVFQCVGDLRCSSETRGSFVVRGSGRITSSRVVSGGESRMGRRGQTERGSRPTKIPRGRVFQALRPVCTRTSSSYFQN